MGCHRAGLSLLEVAAILKNRGHQFGAQDLADGLVPLPLLADVLNEYRPTTVETLHHLGSI